jgi:hypothetical protein
LNQKLFEYILFLARNYAVLTTIVGACKNQETYPISRRLGQAGGFFMAI